VILATDGERISSTSSAAEPVRSIHYGNSKGSPSTSYAHGPLPPAAPAKDYSKNAATGDISTEPETQTGSRADGAVDEGVNQRAP
jgi:hypothetical protein